MTLNVPVFCENSEGMGNAKAMACNSTSCLILAVDVFRHCSNYIFKVTVHQLFQSYVLLFTVFTKMKYTLKV